MDRDTFWSIVDNARKTVDDTYDVAPAVTEKLKELTSDEIVSFKQRHNTSCWMNRIAGIYGPSVTS